MINGPMAEVPLRHFIHGEPPYRQYFRSVIAPAGTVMIGALIAVPTIMFITGECNVFDGTFDEDTGKPNIRYVNGHVEIPTEAGRKTIFTMFQDTKFTTVYPTLCATTEEAMKEFTPEWEILQHNR